jgi:putative redox protein
VLTIETIYTGDLRTLARHVRSGTEIITDAPVDNEGRGEAFSPTDLLAASLGSCMLTVMGIAARKNNFSIDGTRIEITKIMNDKPRFVSAVSISFFMPPLAYTDEQKTLLKQKAESCPVALSLHPQLKQIIEFRFSDGSK